MHSPRIAATTLVGVAAIISAVGSVGAVNESERRASRFEYMNMDLFFNSKRLFSNYVDCLTGKRNCPPEGLDLKKQMPSLLKNACEECTPRQREILVKIFFRMQDEYQAQLKILLKRWDPTGAYFSKFLNYLKESYPEELKLHSPRAKQHAEELISVKF